VLYADSRAVPFLYKSRGMEVIGMTNMSEAWLEPGRKMGVPEACLGI